MKISEELFDICGRIIEDGTIPPKTNECMNFSRDLVSAIEQNKSKICYTLSNKKLALAYHYYAACLSEHLENK